MKEMKRENTGTEGALVKKSQEESLRTESVPTGKAQLRKIQTGERSSGEKAAGKAAWKIPVCYALWATLSVLFTGLIALCLGMNGSVSGEKGKIIVEILSSLLGSIYISFLLGRWKEREWKERRTPGEIKAGLFFGMVLFVCRIISRLVFSLFPEGARGVGYFTVLMIDLICIIFIYLQLPTGGKEVESHDKH